MSNPTREVCYHEIMEANDDELRDMLKALLLETNLRMFQTDDGNCGGYVVENKVVEDDNEMKKEAGEVDWYKRLEEHECKS